MGNKKISMSIVNPNAAGIDVGSRSHFVATSQHIDQVNEFGVYAEDLKALAKMAKIQRCKNCSHGINRHVLAKSIC